jgi:hypothetical protein
VIGRAAALLATLALAVPAAAAAHNPPSYVSTFLGLTPGVRGVTVAIVNKGNGIVLDNRSHRTVVVLGYQREPYLRFGPNGVYRNAHSPATYLNLSLYAGGAIPPSANADAQPLWRKVAPGDVFRWHDHRIHWASPIPPPVVRRAPDRKHHVLDWRVPALVGGTRFAITGTLDYRPGGFSPSDLMLPLALLPLGVLVTLGLVRTLRRTGSAIA